MSTSLRLETKQKVGFTLFYSLKYNNYYSRFDSFTKPSNVNDLTFKLFSSGEVKGDLGNRYYQQTPKKIIEVLIEFIDANNITTVF